MPRCCSCCCCCYWWRWLLAAVAPGIINYTRQQRELPPPSHCLSIFGRRFGRNVALIAITKATETLTDPPQIRTRSTRIFERHHHRVWNRNPFLGKHLDVAPNWWEVFSIKKLSHNGWWEKGFPIYILTGFCLWMLIYDKEFWSDPLRLCVLLPSPPTQRTEAILFLFLLSFSPFTCWKLFHSTHCAVKDIWYFGIPNNDTVRMAPVWGDENPGKVRTNFEVQIVWPN